MINREDIHNLESLLCRRSEPPAQPRFDLVIELTVHASSRQATSFSDHSADRCDDQHGAKDQDDESVCHRLDVE